MNIVHLFETHLIGIVLQKKTSNENGQSSIDCKGLWHQFENGGFAANINGKLSEDIYGVYHDYEGGSDKPFSYFVGCKVEPNSIVPEDMVSIVIPEGKYIKLVAKGSMPECVINIWKQVWQADYPRSYQIDFEVYDDRSKDWSNAEVDVYLSVKEI